MPAPARPLLSDAVPFWLPVAAGLPIALSLLVMAIPSVGHGQSLTYRLFYVAAFLLWTLPLTALQRRCGGAMCPDGQWCSACSPSLI